MAIVVMGVSGTGKSTVGAAIADAFQTGLIEGDHFHPPKNIAKMAAGIPLTDDDRWPWLDRIAAELRRHNADGILPVATCSALKRAYRDRLREGSGLDILFVHLTGSAQALRQRMTRRTGHFMPASLLDDQLATLEPLQPDELSLVVDMETAPGEIAADIRFQFSGWI